MNLFDTPSIDRKIHKVSTSLAEAFLYSSEKNLEGMMSDRDKIKYQLQNTKQNNIYMFMCKASVSLEVLRTKEWSRDLPRKL